MSEEPVMEKSIPVHERKSIERKSIADKMIAVEHRRASSEGAGASHTGMTKAAKVAAEMPSTKAASVPPAKAASMAAMHGGRTQSRTGRDNRHGGQCDRYLPHHDVHSVSCDMHPSLYEDRQSPSSWSAQRRCSMPRLRNPSPTDRSSWEISSASHRSGS